MGVLRRPILFAQPAHGRGTFVFPQTHNLRTMPSRVLASRTERITLVAVIVEEYSHLFNVFVITIGNLYLSLSENDTLFSNCAWFAVVNSLRVIRLLSSKSQAQL